MIDFRFFWAHVAIVARMEISRNCLNMYVRAIKQIHGGVEVIVECVK
jgi:hypothetical protein